MEGAQLSTEASLLAAEALSLQTFLSLQKLAQNFPGKGYGRESRESSKGHILAVRLHTQKKGARTKPRHFP